jgi:two-component system chemotaxis response regulator CheB
VFARRAHIGPETMAHRDIIVIGASLGGVEAIPRLFETLPSDLPAAVFVVLHMHDSGPSRLLEIVRRASSFPVKNAVDGAAAAIHRGRDHAFPRPARGT